MTGSIEVAVSAAVDIVVVGSGIAGLATAIAAAEHGLTAMILECSEKVGGSTSWAFGGVWFPDTDEARALGIVDSFDKAMQFMTYVGGGQARLERTTAFISNASRTLRFYQAAGIPLYLQRGVNDHFLGLASGSLPEGRCFEVSPIQGAVLGDWRDRLLTPEGEFWRLTQQIGFRVEGNELDQLIEVARAHDEIAQGCGLVAHALAAALARGVRVTTGLRASSLLREGTRVVGVRAEDGSEIRARRAVVLASGGFESDESLVDAIENLPDYRSVYPPTLRGDGLRMASEIGGAFRVIHNNAAILLAYEDPRSGRVEVVANTYLRAAHTLVVNRAGQRFGRETTFQDLAPELRRYDSTTRSHRNLPCWMLFDQQFVDSNGFAGSRPGSVPDWVVRAGGLVELADMVGIDGDGLQATVLRFNEFAAKSADTDFRRGELVWKLFPQKGDGANPSLGSLQVAPYYAVQLYPTIINASGLATDECARVQDWGGCAIPGLFALGNAAAHDEYGVGYQSGQSIGSAMTFALLAVETITAHDPD